MGIAIAVLIMVLWNGIVGVTLLRTAARTRKLPELLIGLGLVGLGPISQTFSLLSGSGRGVPVGEVSLLLHGIGTVGSVVGLGCVFLFVHKVFRPGATWAMGLAWASIAALTASGIRSVVGLASSPADVLSSTVMYGHGLVILGLFILAFGWSALEAGLYFVRVRRQQKLGLVEPVVVNRFLLFTISSATGFLLGVFLFVTHLGGNAITLQLVPSITIAAVSLVTGGCMFLAFAPPRAYVSWVERRASAEGAA